MFRTGESMPETRSVRGQTLNKLAQDRIKFHITSKHLKPGDPLPPEAQLASDLGISRGPMREAIRSLESLGIVEVRHGTGIFVREFNFDSMMDLLSFGLVFDQNRIAEICQLRKWLETAAIGEVIERITVKEIAQIEAVFERWRRKIAAQESTAEEDREFHKLLFSVLDNQSLIAMLDIFWVVYHAVPIRAITTDLQPTTTIQDHCNILAAVVARDGARARQCVERHFHGLEERIARARG
jgi:DNA-binding FadR family transcriptional regulator